MRVYTYSYEPSDQSRSNRLKTPAGRLAVWQHKVDKERPE